MPPLRLGQTSPSPERRTGQESSYTQIEYDYLTSGIIVHVTVSKGDPEPFDLEVDFVAPQ
jgi:hypothetical protein